MSCLYFLCCGLLEVCAGLIRAVFRRFRDLSSLRERLSGKTTLKSEFHRQYKERDVSMHKAANVSNECLLYRVNTNRATARNRSVGSIFPSLIFLQEIVKSERKILK